MRLFIWTVLSCVLFYGCGNSGEKQNAIIDSISAVDTISAKPKIKSIEKEKIFFNDTLGALAHYVGGLKCQGSWKDSALYKKQCWKEFSKRFSKNWKRLDSTRYQLMRKWAIENVTVSDSIIFYPFAGADFLNADIFFPDAKTYILIGLEPVGTLPYFDPKINNDSLALYFNSLYSSLHAILNFSFFRTLSMEEDFKHPELNGTVHLLMLFLARTDHRIINIEPIAIDTSGNELVSTFKNINDNSGVRISYAGADSIKRTLYYFSVNLHNSSLRRNNGFFTYIKKLGSPITYLKSASYLMHKDYFSVIRWYITHNSKAVLQDDSGIPLKYFPDTAWTKVFYGRYNTIPMFSNFLQESMTDVYNDSLNIKPLPFGIGYKFKAGESNLMFAVKNNLSNNPKDKSYPPPNKILKKNNLTDTIKKTQ